ncbi:MAG: class I tRNA ligase family protein, partial [Planctomycetota bacterium]
FDDYVSREEGTGCVHTAPGHGEEDYYTGLKYGLKPYSPVNEEGKFQGTVDWLNGKDVFIAQDEIVEFLKNKNILLLKEDIQHSYPTCWRCKNALIYRATYQWFLNVDKDSLRQKLLDATETVEWIPQWGKTRISNMIKNRPHWCLSRQRSWGVPLPIFYCNKCGHYLTNVEIIERIRKLFSQYGSNIWFEKDEKFLLEKEYNCQICGSQDFTKGLDIFDVWFESGVSWFAVLPDDPRLSYPCNYYLEGNDQHRGWFQVSLIPSVAINNIPPYKTVLTHGFIITEQGEKISKSADTGKIFSSSYLLKEYGADILRLAVLAWNAPDDLPISRKYLDQVASNYVKIRNTFRFMLANLYDFNPQNHSIEYKNFSFVDKVFYNKMIETLRMIEQHRRQYQFHKIYSLVTNFIIVELSALYFDIVKEKLYTLSSDALSRRSTQNVLWQLLRNFTIALAPVIPHTAEEIYSFSPHKSYPSVHLESWFNVETQDIDRKLLEDWDKIVKVRDEVNKILEELRSKKIIGRSREAEIEIKIKDNSFHQFLNSIHDELADIFLVSKVTFYLDSSLSSDYLIFAKKSDAPKCARCWLHTHSVGKNPRHPTICEKCLSIIEKLTR